MIQCKIFSSNKISEIEKEVNDFIRVNSRILIESIHQAASNQQLFITIFYHSRTKAARIKEAAIDEIKVPITIPLSEKS